MAACAGAHIVARFVVLGKSGRQFSEKTRPLSGYPGTSGICVVREQGSVWVGDVRCDSEREQERVMRRCGSEDRARLT